MKRDYDMLRSKIKELTLEDLLYIKNFLPPEYIGNLNKMNAEFNLGLDYAHLQALHLELSPATRHLVIKNPSLRKELDFNYSEEVHNLSVCYILFEFGAFLKGGYIGVDEDLSDTYF